MTVGFMGEDSARVRAVSVLCANFQREIAGVNGGASQSRWVIGNGGWISARVHLAAKVLIIDEMDYVLVEFVFWLIATASTRSTERRKEVSLVNQFGASNPDSSDSCRGWRARVRTIAERWQVRLPAQTRR